MNGVPTTKSGLHLLVVEDSPLMRGRIVDQLSELEEIAEIAEADDVQSALRLLETSAPMVAIVDFHLPDGNGLEVIRAIKRRDERICVIVFTTHIMETVRLACLQEGADFFFSKAVDFTDVEEVVRQVALRYPADEGEGGFTTP